MVLRAPFGRMVISCAALILAGLHAAQAQPAPRAAQGELRYTVREGDTIWDISDRLLDGVGRAAAMLRLNQIAEPTRLQPGTAVRIPRHWLRREPARLQLDSVYGAAWILETDGNRHAARVGEFLEAGRRLVTDEDSSVTLSASTGSRMLLLPQSEVAVVKVSRPISLIDEPAVAGPGARGEPLPEQTEDFEISLLLVKGKIENVVRRIDPFGPGRFEIRTPAGVAAVRGTEFRVATTPGRTRSELLSGAVELGNPRGKVRLEQGQGAIVETGKRPRPPRPLLAAPALPDLPQTIERLPIDLPIALLAGASRYRTQFALDPEFRAVVSDELVERARLRARDLPDGDYHVRVRGADADGIEGLSTQRAIRVHARPEPPMTIGPAHQALETAERPQFRWTQAASAAQGRRVRLQLASTEDFSAPIVDHRTDDPHHYPSELALAPGIYHWRIASIDPVIGQGPWSDPQTFRRVVPAPGMEAPEQLGDSVNLRWRSLPGAASYQVQVASGQDFLQRLIDDSVTGETLQIPRPDAGVYYVRVRSVAGDGFSGPWGEPQAFSVDPPGSRWEWLWLLTPLLFAL